MSNTTLHGSSPQNGRNAQNWEVVLCANVHLNAEACPATICISVVALLAPFQFLSEQHWNVNLQDPRFWQCVLICFVCSKQISRATVEAAAETCVVLSRLCYGFKQRFGPIQRHLAWRHVGFVRVNYRAYIGFTCVFRFRATGMLPYNGESNGKTMEHDMETRVI